LSKKIEDVINSSSFKKLKNAFGMNDKPDNIKKKPKNSSNKKGTVSKKSPEKSVNETGESSDIAVVKNEEPLKPEVNKGNFAKENIADVEDTLEPNLETESEREPVNEFNQETVPKLVTVQETKDITNEIEPDETDKQSSNPVKK